MSGPTRCGWSAPDTEASGSPKPFVQWQVSKDAGTTWTDIPGADKRTYTTGWLYQSNDQSLYRAEFYTPKEKRVYGFYALPVLHGEELIGRVDVENDRKRGRVVAQKIFAEPGARVTRETGNEIASSLRGLATFLGKDEIEFTGEAPKPWSAAVRRA